MVATREKAIEIAGKARAGLEKIYGVRLRMVYLYGSAARGQLHPDSDIDIAVILDDIKDRFEEYEKISQLGSDISLEYDTLVSFLLVSESDYQIGRFAVHRKIREEGIAA
jgi:predicted nucleotidyltransferase